MDMSYDDYEDALKEVFKLQNKKKADAYADSIYNVDMAHQKRAAKNKQQFIIKDRVAIADYGGDKRKKIVPCKEIIDLEKAKKTHELKVKNDLVLLEKGDGG